MDNIEDFEDETVWERIQALDEMIPESIKSTFWTTKSVCSTVFRKTKGIAWALASTGAILILPISLEKERQEYLEQMKRQERNIILGPQ